MKKIYYSILTGVLCVFISLTSKSQVTVAGSTGANGTYPSLTLAGGAFAAINAAGTQAGNNITVTITADLLTETGANPLNASDWTTLTISPSGGAIRNVQGNVNGPLIDLNGADNVTIDGLNTGGNALNIDNQNGVSASTIRFINDASNNTLVRCNILGASGITAGPALGTIYFAGGTTTGNDNNAISQCILSASVTGTPQNAIYSLGTSAAVDNSNNTIFACLINDFFNPTNSSSGVNINSFNSGWLISNNVFYQTATRTATAAANIPSVIFITSGNGYTIINNIIGGSNTSGGGAPWTFNGAFTNRFVGINVASAAGATTTIQNNTITNLNLSTTSGASTGNGIFCGISANGAGTFNIGSGTGNIIGAISGVGSISTTASTTAALTVGINVTCTGATTLSNNSIGSITANGSAATVSASITGIQITAGTPIVTNNVIGSTTTANSINSATVSTTGSQLVNGINISAGVTVPTTITGNTIANLNQNGITTGAVCRGIIYSGTGLATISNNIVNNISGSTANTTVAGGATGVQGICYTGTSPAGAIISQNEVYTIRATNANGVATWALGIGYSNPTNGRVFKNRIYDIRNASTMTTATTPPVAAGILIRSTVGTPVEVSNNLISLGNGQTTNTEFIGIINSFNTGTVNAYFNSVNIEGSVSAGALPSFAFLRGDNTAASAINTTINAINNIFNNSRTGGTGNHYAIGNNYGNGTSSATGWAVGASNYNVLNSQSIGTIGYWNTSLNIANWRTSSGGDGNSLSGIPVVFTNTTTADLHLNFGVTPTQIESGGTVISGITDDYDNQVRPGPTGSTNGGATAPDIGADEFDGVPLDLFSPTITYSTLLNTTCTTNRAFTANATDNSGVNVTVGTRPRVYYKRSTDGNTWNDNTNATDGWKYAEASNATSPFNFIIDYGLLNGGTGVSLGSVVQYFVVAQDLASTPNVGINAGTFSATPSTVALTATAFPIGGVISQYNIVTGLSTTITVGAAGDYPFLTGTGGLFSAINANGLTGNTTVNILDASITEPGAFALNQIQSGDCSASTYSLLIKPNVGVTSTLTGSLASNALIRVLSSNVTIDGSNNGTTTRDLTITNTNVTTPSVILLGSVGTTPIVNTTVRNSLIINGAQTATALVVSDQTLGTAGYFNNITIQNNEIRQAFIGNYNIAVPVAGNGSGLNISNNQLNAAGTIAIRRHGIYVQGVDGATISNNTIGNFEAVSAENDNGIWLATATINTTISKNIIQGLLHSGTANAPTAINITSNVANAGIVIDSNTISTITSAGGAVGSSTRGIFVGLATSGVNIIKNTISNIQNTSATGWGANGIHLASTSTAANINVRNNFISNVFANGFAGSSEDDNGYGITVSAGGGYNIDHNSINLNSNQVAAGGLPASINITSGVTTASSVNIRNNIFANTQTGGSTQRYAILSTAANSVFGTIDYNNYYTNGANLGRIAAIDRAALTDIQTGFGGNANSLNVLPVFTSVTDLHLTTANCALDNKGTPIAGITTDIDNQTRDAIVPDMGADEFDAASATLFNTVGTTITETRTVSALTIFKSPVCERFASLLPNGGSPISGSVTSRVYKYATVQTYNAEPYVQRVIDITPATGAATATGRVTLYYTQQEFDDFNTASGPWADLPTGPADATGIANLRITKYGGTPNTTPSQPNMYSAGTYQYINPPDADIVWNATDNRWEVTIDVVGFSGFYVHTNSQFALPIVFNYLTGVRQGTNHLLNWKVTCTSSPTATLILERSGDNRTFTAINTVNATALRCADPFNYTDANPLLGLNYYRVKIIDANGKVSYGNTIALLNAVKGFEVLNVAPNPVSSNGAFKLNVSAAKAETIGVVITDMQGRVIDRMQVNIIAGFNTIPMDISKLAAGTYNLQVSSSIGDKSKVLRVVKQ